MSAPLDEYAFDTTRPEAGYQFAALEEFLDPVTTRCLDPIGVKPGWSCWEVGAGGGSIAHHLARRVGPAGRVTATDQDTSRLTPAGSLTADPRDIRHQPAPPGGPFHLVHARLLLTHVRQRREVLARFIDAVRPGGWVVIGEFDATAPPPVLTTPSHDAALLYQRVIETFLGVLTSHGADLAWATQVHPAMVEAGLTQVHTLEHAESWTGGASGIRLHEANALQKHDELLDAGLAAADLSQFRELIRDPAFACMSYRFVCTLGRKAA